MRLVSFAAAASRNHTPRERTSLGPTTKKNKEKRNTRNEWMKEQKECREDEM